REGKHLPLHPARSGVRHAPPYARLGWGGVKLFPRAAFQTVGLPLVGTPSRISCSLRDGAAASAGPKAETTPACSPAASARGSRRLFSVRALHTARGGPGRRSPSDKMPRLRASARAGATARARGPAVSPSRGGS